MVCVCVCGGGGGGGRVWQLLILRVILLSANVALVKRGLIDQHREFNVKI